MLRNPKITLPSAEEFALADAQTQFSAESTDIKLHQTNNASGLPLGGANVRLKVQRNGKPVVYELRCGLKTAKGVNMGF